MHGYRKRVHIGPGCDHPGSQELSGHFKVNKRRQCSLHGTVKDKTTGRMSIGKWSDHKDIECKLSVTVLAAKTAANVPVINHLVPGRWAKYNEVSNKRAHDVIALIDIHVDVNL